MEDFKPEDIPLDILRAIQIPKRVFLTSLIIGTLLLIAFLITKDPGLIGIGICYVAIAFVANTGTLISMIVYALRHRKHLSLILWHTPILLLNIPIAWMYMIIVATVAK
ncbi:hypothetical protein HYN59_15715 [Flavobacterium album]|uniref:Uncharacterized protein n=1 Tax=Flavobacterium album TaxID=2175091 RepID=A0A2S1R1K9_9FLAO|nr:hypothetical protein [Flavobacterium album]AWH86466.1 hypothetical protein HYN59_15715 [Flavobacterium album]